MIKTIEHATAVQTRRYKAGLKGTSKAVRRFFKRTAPNDYRAHMASVPSSFNQITRA